MEDAANLIGLLIPATYLIMWGAEKVAPARSFPPIRGWGWIGLVFLLVMGAISTVVPLALPTDWLAAHRLVDGSGLGIVGGAAVGFFVVSLVNYFWHRATHASSFLWRVFHQLHHSPQRVDMPGAVVFHPFDITVYVAISIFTAVFILGLDPIAAALTGYVASFYSFFQHLNVRTPPWLGYIIQRPEMHCVHHRRGLHGYNYSDFPLWDILFGTFRNPKAFQGDVGFSEPAAGRIGSMLAFVDVNNAEYGAASRGVSPANEPVVGRASVTV